MPTIRRNDAQTDRYLAALRSINPNTGKRDYLVSQIRKIAKVKPNAVISQLPPAKQKEYKAVRRRLERWVTTATEKRSFERSPVQYKREARAVARKSPIPKYVQAPVKPKPKPRPEPPPREYEPPPVFREPPAYEYDEDELEEIETRRARPRERDIDSYDLRAIVAFHDGDIRETNRALDGGRSGPGLLELVGTGVGVQGLEGADRLIAGAREFLDTLDDDELQDVTDFTTLLNNLSDWQIDVILTDLELGATTFQDWMDAYRDSNEDIDMPESEFWELFRRSYGKQG